MRSRILLVCWIVSRCHVGAINLIWLPNVSAMFVIFEFVANKATLLDDACQFVDRVGGKVLKASNRRAGGRISGAGVDVLKVDMISAMNVHDFRYRLLVILARR